MTFTRRANPNDPTGFQWISSHSKYVLRGIGQVIQSASGPTETGEKGGRSSGGETGSGEGAAGSGTTGGGTTNGRGTTGGGSTEPLPPYDGGS